MGQEHRSIGERPDLLVDLSEGNAPVCGKLPRHVGKTVLLLFAMGIPA